MGNHEGGDYASSSSQEVTVYLLARRPYLRRVPDPDQGLCWLLRGYCRAGRSPLWQVTS